MSVMRLNDNQQLILAAIQQQEFFYQSSRTACLALTISSLYQRLCMMSVNHCCDEQWRFLSWLWWQRYCLRRGKPPNTPMPQQALQVFDQLI